MAEDHGIARIGFRRGGFGAVCSSGDLLERKLRNVRPLLGVFHRQRDDVALAIHVEQGVLIKITRFNDFRLAELDVQRIGVLEVFDVQGEPPVKPSVDRSQ